MCLSNFGDLLSKRESWGTQESQALVSFVKLHKSVSSSTVSRWLKEGLSMAGIDTMMFLRVTQLVQLETARNM